MPCCFHGAESHSIPPYFTLRRKSNSVNFFPQELLLCTTETRVYTSLNTKNLNHFKWKFNRHLSSSSTSSSFDHFAYFKNCNHFKSNLLLWVAPSLILSGILYKKQSSFPLCSKCKKECSTLVFSQELLLRLPHECFPEDYSLNFFKLSQSLSLHLIFLIFTSYNFLPQATSLSF